MPGWLYGGENPKYSLLSTDGSGPYTSPVWLPSNFWEWETTTGADCWVACYFFVGNGIGEISTGQISLQRLDAGVWKTISSRTDLRPWYWSFDGEFWILNEGDVLVYNLIVFFNERKSYRFEIIWGDPPGNPVGPYYSDPFYITGYTTAIPGSWIAPVVCRTVETEAVSDEADAVLIGG